MTGRVPAHSEQLQGLWAGAPWLGHVARASLLTFILPHTSPLCPGSPLPRSSPRPEPSMEAPASVTHPCPPGVRVLLSPGTSGAGGREWTMVEPASARSPRPITRPPVLRLINQRGLISLWLLPLRQTQARGESTVRRVTLRGAHCRKGCRHLRASVLRERHTEATGTQGRKPSQKDTYRCSLPTAGRGPCTRSRSPRVSPHSPAAL